MHWPSSDDSNQGTITHTPQPQQHLWSCGALATVLGRRCRPESQYARRTCSVELGRRLRRPLLGAQLRRKVKTHQHTHMTARFGVGAFRQSDTRSDGISHLQAPTWPEHPARSNCTAHMSAAP